MNFGALMIAFWLVAAVIGLSLAVRHVRRKNAEQKRAHEARLQAMVHMATAAAKKAAAQKAQAAGPPAVTAPPASPLPAAAAEPPREERECPFCAERILKKARVCKHCGRDVEPMA